MLNYKSQLGPQSTAIGLSFVPELFFGGARGGGKSLYLLLDFRKDIFRYGSKWRGIIIRKSFPELQDLLEKSFGVFGEVGGIWKEGKKMWVFPGGAKLLFRHLDSIKDASKYQGHEFTWIGWDELSNWPTDKAYRMLFACLRSSANVPTKRIRATGNPGGVGHVWVKSRFVDVETPYTIIKDEETKLERVFIPSRVADNPKLLLNDPDYIKRLHFVGSKALVKAWLEGDWDVVAGQYFDNFVEDLHVIFPFRIPDSWMRFRCFDWGSASPYACLWVAVSDGTTDLEKGTLVVYRELYGGINGVGLKETIEEVAIKIKSLENTNEHINYSVADPAIFKEDGGPSHAEKFHRMGVSFVPGDNRRLNGWQEIRSRLKDEKIKIFKNCLKTIEGFKTSQHDVKNPEDLNSEGDDHIMDALRYGAMSRPYVITNESLTKPKSPIHSYLERIGKPVG